MSDVHIFISWSLPSSQKTAKKAHEFFRRLFPTFSFFISSENISSGQRWYDVISERLDVCNIGLIVVTQENHLRPWIHYEAGALAKVVSKARVMPLLCGVTPGTIADTPLSAFQAAELNKQGILKIADSIREMTGYVQREADFKEHFDSLWERYGVALCEVEPSPADHKPRAPQAKPAGDAEVGARLDQLTEIVRSIEARLPSRPLSEADMSRIVAASVRQDKLSPSEIASMSPDELLSFLGLAEPRPTENALSGANYALSRARKNALEAEGGNPIRRGLLGGYVAADPNKK